MQYRESRILDKPFSVIGLGGGGSSKMGIGTNTAEAVLKTALDLGVTYFDTAEVYGTEAILGSVTEGLSHKLILSSKLSYQSGGRCGALKTRDEIMASLSGSLRKLRREYLDIYYVHGVWREDYEAVLEKIVPVLEDARDQGLIRSIGITEMFSEDPEHRTLRRALRDSCWDFYMAGYNLLNQTADQNLLSEAMSGGREVVAMFAVRNALRSWEALVSYLEDLDALSPQRKAVLEELRRWYGEALPSLAYRFVCDNPGIISVLSGTGNPDHLMLNVNASAAPPLSPETNELLRKLSFNLPVCSGQ